MPQYDREHQIAVHNLLLQCFIVFACLSLLLLFTELFGGIAIASLGASCFILFITPHTASSQARNVLGGYLCGACVGVFFGITYSQLLGSILFEMDFALVLTSAAAAAFTAFLMTSMKLVHPPAAALALGLAADLNCLVTALAAIVSILVLCLIRNALSSRLKNLV